MDTSHDLTNIFINCISRERDKKKIAQTMKRLFKHTLVTLPYKRKLQLDNKVLNKTTGFQLRPTFIALRRDITT